MANTLKVWMAPNTVTPDPKDKIFILETTGKADINKIYEEMRAEDTGLRPETIVHVVTLFERICARLLMNGWQLNTGLFYAVPRLLGLAEDGRWNPEKNSIYVAFTQNKVVREESAKTSIAILGEKADVMYIIGTEDRLKLSHNLVGRISFRQSGLQADRSTSQDRHGLHIPEKQGSCD